MYFLNSINALKITEAVSLINDAIKKVEIVSLEGVTFKAASVESVSIDKLDNDRRYIEEPDYLLIVRLKSGECLTRNLCLALEDLIVSTNYDDIPSMAIRVNGSQDRGLCSDCEGNGD